MLQDEERTRFVVVCIAEYLSICETRRLLKELRKCNVTASHVIVNQLVDDYLTKEEMEKLQGLLGDDKKFDEGSKDLKRKVVSCCQLTTSRNAIQKKYLEELKSYPEVNSINTSLAVIEVPLLPSEVTGHAAILEFSRLLVSDGQEKRAKQRRLSPSKQPSIREEGGVWNPKVGDRVTINGLVKKPEYNGRVGEIISYNEESKRFGIKFATNNMAENAIQTIAVLRANITRASKSQEKPTNDMDKGMDIDNKTIKEKVDKYSKLLEDPEIAAMVTANPKLGEAVKDVQSNPMNFMKYMMDPEMAPFIQKAMNKFRNIA